MFQGYSLHKTYAPAVRFLMSCQSALALHTNLYAAQCGVTVHHTAVHHSQAHAALSACLQHIVVG